MSVFKSTHYVAPAQPLGIIELRFDAPPLVPGSGAYGRQNSIIVITLTIDEAVVLRESLNHDINLAKAGTPS